MFLENDEMKFAILYTLNVYKYPLSIERFAELLTWDEEVMSYFDLTILLSELIEDEFIERLYYRNEECVKLTQKGESANEFFYERVPLSIRENIKSLADKEGFDEKTNPNAILTDILPVSRNRYMASMTILDAGTPILELKIDVVHRSEANKAKSILKDHAEQIYKYLCKTIDENK